MKVIQLSDLEKQALLATREVISVENNGKLIGYYHPIVEQKEVEQAKKELDQVMEQVLTETGLTEEEYVTLFMNAEPKSCA